MGITRLILLSFSLILGLSACSETTTVAGPTGASTSEVAFHAAMDRLWEDHIEWTRNVIINVIDELPGGAEATARLLQNQDEIGNAIKPYYGDGAGAQLSAMLRSHIMGAAAVLTAAKSGDQAGLTAASDAWIANADSIASFLSSANPTNWTAAEMKSMMREHLTLTTNEAVARLTKNYGADISHYDAVHTQILKMSDMLADGIIKQFPDKF